MRCFLGIACGVVALAASLSASTIDVSSQSSQLLQTGDSLEFLLSSSSYARYASATEISPDPVSIAFTFASSPLITAGQFTAELESADGSAAAEFSGPIGWTGGYDQSSGYSGPISTLVGSLTLPAALSQALFAGAEAELLLTYSGPDANVGLQGYDLRHDLWVSLSGGPLSIGGLVYSADYNNGADSSRALSDDSTAAEPNSIVLLATGAGLCLIAAALKRFGRFGRTFR